jgi:hypothetical protein
MAVSLPIPLAAPVTSATRPSNSPARKDCHGFIAGT